MSGPLRYLNSSAVLISKAWAWRETTAGPQPKQTDNWSARHAMKRRRVKVLSRQQTQTHTNSHKHTHARLMLLLFCVPVREREKNAVSHFSSFNWRMKRNWLGWTLTIELKFANWAHALCHSWPFLCVSLSFYMRPTIYMGNKFLLNQRSTILWLGVLTSHYVELYTVCSGLKLGQHWFSATTVLAPICEMEWELIA